MFKLKNNKLTHNSNIYVLNRYPNTNDKNLKAWSNAELLAIDYLQNLKFDSVHLFNDRFGVWNCLLNSLKSISVFTYASQKKAVLKNLELNKFSTKFIVKSPLDDLESVEVALLKIPKSLDLFELFLQQIHKASSENTYVVCCFMTKYFSSSFLKVASLYFEELEQSKAWKKARLLILRKPKKDMLKKLLINQLTYQSLLLKQYYGVFASSKIDIGTQFLLKHLSLKANEKTVLDLASGNGIIARVLVEQNPNITISLMDDFNLAIESSKLNLQGFNANFIWNDTLEQSENNVFDLVVSNPPFHFEYENNIEVALSLFRDVKRVLKPEGRFVLVANKHLNYKTHLIKLFSQVNLLAENTKFVIYECH